MIIIECDQCGLKKKMTYNRFNSYMNSKKGIKPYRLNPRSNRKTLLCYECFKKRCWVW